MAPTIFVALQPSTISIEAGAEATLRVTVHNRSQEVGQYHLRVEGVEPAWALFEPDQVGAFPGEEAMATLRLRPPQGTPPATYPLAIIVEGLIGQRERAKATASLTVGAAAGAEPAAEPRPAPAASAPAAPAVSALPSAPAPVTPAPTTATVEAAPIAAAPASVPPVPAAPAPARASVEPTPAVPPPATSATPPAPLPTAEPALRAVSPGSGQLELTCDRDSLMMLAGAQAQLSLTLHNAGGTSLTVDLSTKGFPSSWLALGMASVTLAPGRSAATVLSLSPAAQAPAGSYPLTIAAVARDAPTIAARLDLVIEIAEAGGLLIEVIPAQAEGQAEAIYQVRVTQTGVAPLRLRLSAADSRSECSYLFDPDTVTAPASGSVSATLTVTARRGISGADAVTHLFTVSAAGVDTGAAISQAQGRFIQRRPPALSVALEPAEGRGPGRTVYAVRVANRSQIAATLTLSASDAKGACTYEIAPAELTLPAGGETIAHLTVAPLAYQAGPGEIVHTFELLAQPASPLLEPARAEGRFIQTAMALPALALTPSSQMSTRAARFKLQVQNPRGEALEVSLAASIDADTCTFAITPPQLVVPAGGQATARLTVTPRTGLLAGESRRVHAFQVAAQPADLSVPAVAQGSLVQVRRAGVGGWLPWVLGVLAVGLLGAALALLLLPGGPAVTPTPMPATSTATVGPDLVSTARAVQGVTETAISRATLEQQNAETAVAQATLAAQKAATAAAIAAQERQTLTAQAQATKMTKDGQLTGTAVAKAVQDAQKTASAAQTKAAIPPTKPPASPTPPPAPPTQPPIQAVIAHPTAREYQPAATSRLVFEVHAWNPAVGSNNGAGIRNVDMRIINSANQVVYQRTENTASYCAFSGGEPDCVVWVFADHGMKWPNGASIQAGTYTLQAIVNANDGRTRTLSTTVRIQP